MNQKTTTSFACKIEGIESSHDVSEFKKFDNQETDPKKLDQAIHNVSLGMELVSVVENAYDEIEAILSEVKPWVSPDLASNLENTRKSDFERKVSQKLQKLDQVAKSFKHNDQKFLDGSMSASANPDSHSFLVVGANGSPENRINLNKSLNIPLITSETLGLGDLSIGSPQKGLKGLMILENSLAIINRLKQRSSALRTHLKEIKRHLATAVENHCAANSAPDSYGQTREILRAATSFLRKDKREY